ncbi:Glycosyl transferases group 1 [Musa troglodytarum]|uniref:Glycosyl transferases group 1 n=1 Tax=Musa troglodytarum TaxID=320322 RepID=A0A9E7L130_9LILI|nr:Glycosyl transferases group 1 [Musa troglodytarum]
MSRPAFSRRGLHADSLPGHLNDGAGGRSPADRRNRLPPRKGTGCRWTQVLLGGLVVVVLAFFGLGIWQLTLMTSAGGPGEFVSRIGGGGRRARPVGSVLRFVPSDLMRRFEEQRSALDRRRSDGRLGLRPPRLALVIEDTYKDSNSLMLLTLVKSLMDLGYTFMIFTLENNEAHFLWQSVGCQLSVLDSDSLRSVDWSNYEGVIVSSLEGKKVIPRLMQEPFMSVPLIWIVHEDILGKRLSHYAELGWKDLINEWRNAFIRADAVVFPDFSLPMLYTLLDNGNFFVISGSPVDIWATSAYIASHSRNQLRGNYGFAENDLLILVVGSYFFYGDPPWDYRVMHALVPQVKRIKELIGTIKFVFLCGNSTDAYSSTFQDVALRMGFPDGSVRHYDMDHDVNNFLYMADIVLYWSFIEEQNFPPLLLQAMSFEIPIVAPNMTVIRKYVANNVHGILFHPSTLDTLVRALSLLIGDKELSNIAHSVASHGKSLSMNMLASECISGYAELFESILHFPSDTLLPNSISQIQQKTWLWDLLDKEIKQTYAFTENENLLRNEYSRQRSSIVYLLEEQFSKRLMENDSQLVNKTYAEDFPTLSDWDDISDMEASEDYVSREMQEFDERMERTSGSWEDVYRNSRKAEKQKAEAYERDEGELERTGQPLCIYEVYTGEGAWPFLHHGSIYRGITLSFRARRSKSDDIDAVSRLPVLNDTYYRDLLCETGAMFAVANSVDSVHKLPWIGFQSWRAAGKKVSLSHAAEEVLEKTTQRQSKGDIIYYWAVMDMGLNKVDINRKLDFWSTCDLLNAAKCRVMFEDAFRQMYGLPPGMRALPPMPFDGDHWSVLHSWVMPTPSFLEFIMFARIFADSLDSLNQNNSSLTSCILGSSRLEIRHCYCRVLEVLVNVWAYHSGRKMVYLDPFTGELKEQHPLELRDMWVKYFNSDLLKSMDEDLAEKADDGMHPNDRWLWPLTGEVHWQGILDREREERLKQKMDKKKKTREKLLERQKHGYKQKSLGQKDKSP